MVFLQIALCMVAGILAASILVTIGMLCWFLIAGFKDGSKRKGSAGDNRDE